MSDQLSTEQPLLKKTKLELVEEIQRLENLAREQRRALDQQAANAVEVEIPNVGYEYSGVLSHAPYIQAKAGEKNGDVWRHKFLPVIFKAIRKHGVRKSIHDGISGQSVIEFVEGCGAGESYVIPEPIADFLLEIVNEAGSFGQRCYTAGVDESAGILKQLANGQITEKEYEDRTAIERSNEHNAWKTYGKRRYNRKARL